VKYSIVHGPDWSIVSGIEEGVSQLSKSNLESNSAVVWNFPVDVGFRSNNAFGWPQIVLSVYGMDTFGRDVIRGYGCVHLPMQPGL
jgi:B9 domain-containing protein 1